MRVTIAAMVLALCAGQACTYSTEHGECVGLGASQAPGLVYETSGWNVFIGAAFTWAFFIPPAVVLSSAWSCPRRRRSVTK